MRAANAGDTPYPCRNTITLRTSRCALHASRMARARDGPMPGTSLMRAGSLSRISSVSMPKRSTMRDANSGPIPLISPEPR